jgi:hypothetical protein
LTPEFPGGAQVPAIAAGALASAAAITVASAALLTEKLKERFITEKYVARRSQLTPFLTG